MHDINYSDEQHKNFLAELISLRDLKISKQIKHNLKKNNHLQQWLYQSTKNFLGVLQPDGTRKDNIGARCYAVIHNITTFVCDHGVEKNWDGDKKWERGFTKGCDECANKSRSQKVSDTLNSFSDEKWSGITKKRSETLDETYGVTNPGRLPQAIKAHKNFYANKENVSKAVEKGKQTYKVKTGYEHPLSDPTIREKIQQTSLLKYGYEYPMMNKDIAAKSNQNRDKNAEKQAQLKTGHFKFINYFEHNHNVTIDITEDEWSGINNYKTLDFICLECGGINNRTIVYHYSAIYCPICDVRTRNASKGELELREYLTALYPTSVFEYSNRKLIAPKEIDIVDHTQKIAFEYNGLYYHKENNQSTPKGPYYHIGKTNEMDENGYQLVTIYEDEWSRNNMVVRDYIRRLYSINEDVKNSSDLIPMIIDIDNTSIFLAENNINGYVPSDLFIGLVQDDIIYSIMGISKMEDEYYSIDSYTDKVGFDILNSIPVLLNALKNNLNMTNFIHYHDRRWGVGEGWKNANFECISTSEPVYDYVNKTSTLRETKSEYSIDVLTESGYTGKDDENEIFNFMQSLGYDRIWNSGYNVYYINIGE